MVKNFPSQHQIWGPKHNFWCSNLLLNVNSSQTISQFISQPSFLNFECYFSLSENIGVSSGQGLSQFRTNELFLLTSVSGKRKTFLHLSMGPNSWKWQRQTPITMKTMVLVQFCANSSLKMWFFSVVDEKSVTDTAFPDCFLVHQLLLRSNCLTKTQSKLILHSTQT